MSVVTSDSKVNVIRQLEEADTEGKIAMIMQKARHAKFG